nr:MAG TPA: hypothetical protein [Caudoviricetes sp.]
MNKLKQGLRIIAQIWRSDREFRYLAVIAIIFMVASFV